MSYIPICGDILTTKEPSKYTISFNNIKAWLFKGGVYLYQKKMFPETNDRKSLWSTHSRIWVGDKWLSTTTPRTKYEYPDLDNTKIPFYISRYTNSFTFGKASEDAIKEMAEKLIGTPYDYKQIGGMALTYLFPNLPKPVEEYLQTADKDKVVCSVATLSCLIAAWKATDRSYERPGGDPNKGGIFLEAAPPAALILHPTFKTVFKSKNW